MVLEAHFFGKFILFFFMHIAALACLLMLWKLPGSVNKMLYKQKAEGLIVHFT